MIISTGRRHLGAVTRLPLADWDEAARVERERPFVVRGTMVELGGERSVVLFGRCTNVPFGSVSFADRRRLGSELRDYVLEALSLGGSHG
jgi:hypothetical protein